MRVTFPDGTVVNDVPEGTTQDELLTRMKAGGYDVKKLLSTPTAEPTEYAGFFGSFGESLAQTAKAGAAASKFAADPNEENRKALLEASKSKYKQMDFEHAQNLPEYWEAFKELAGGSLGQMATPLAAAAGATAATAETGPAAPFIGAGAGFTTGTAQYAVSNLIRTAQEQQAAIDAGKTPSAVDLGKLAISSAAQSGLDIFEVGQFKRLFKLFPGMGKVLGQEGEKAAESEVRKAIDAVKSGDATYAKKAGVGIIKGAGFEIPQEVVQQGLERWQAGLSLTNDDALNEYKQAAIGALVLGGPAGAVEGLIHHAHNVGLARAEEQAKKNKDAVDKQAAEEAAVDEGEKAKAGEEELPEVAPAKAAPAFVAPTGIEGVEAAPMPQYTDRIADILKESDKPLTQKEILTQLTSNPALKDANANHVKSALLMLQADGKALNEKQRWKYSGPEEAVTPPDIATAPTTATRDKTATEVLAEQNAAQKTEDLVKSILPKTPEEVAASTAPVKPQTAAEAAVTKAEETATGFFRNSAELREQNKQLYARLKDAEAAKDTQAIAQIQAQLEQNKAELSRVMAPNAQVTAPAATEAPATAPATPVEMRQAAEGEPNKLLRTAIESGNWNNVLDHLSGEGVAEEERTTLNKLAELLRTGPMQFSDEKPKAPEINYNKVKLNVEGIGKTDEKGIARLKKEGKLAEYDPKTNTIHVTKEGLTSENLLHETVHAATVGAVREFYTESNTNFDGRKKLEEASRVASEKAADIDDALAKLKEESAKATDPNAFEDQRKALKQEAKVALNAASKANDALQRYDERRTAVQQIKQIFKEAAGKYVNGMLLARKYPQAFENLYEFIAYGMTNPTFQSDLAKVRMTRPLYTFKEGRYRQTDIDNTTERTSVRTLWNAFTQAISRVLGLTQHRGANIAADKARDIQDRIESLESKLEDLQNKYSEAPSKAAKTVLESQMNDLHYQIEDKNKELLAAKRTYLSEASSLKEGNAMLEMSEAVSRLLQTPTRVKGVPGLAVRKKAEVNTESVEEYEARRLEATKKIADGNTVKDAVKHFVRSTPEQSLYERIVTAFQNDRRPLKRLEEILRAAGKLITGQAGFNDVYGQIVRSSQIADFAASQYVEPLKEALYGGIDAYAKKHGLSTLEALNRLDMYLMALHEEERRMVKYIRNVPLNNTQALHIRALDPKARTAAEWREWIYQQLHENKNLTDKNIRRADGTLISKAEQYRDILQNKLLAYVDESPSGMSPNGSKTKDINDIKYNVIGSHPPEFFKEIRDKYEAEKADVQPVIDAVRKLQDNTKKLDRESNYWTQPVNNIAGFYDYQHYVPFKGKVVSKVDQADDQYEYGGARLGGDYSESAREFHGRESDSDNVLTQTVADAMKSALRYGRKDVARSIFNAMEQGHIATKRTKSGKMDYKTINFRDRFDGVDPAEQKGPNKIFLYEPDGSIKILDITNPLIRDAVRRVYTESNDFLAGLGKITSTMGQAHTRYNIGFHPYNFVRDTLTNAGIMAAEGRGGLSYLKNIATNIATGGMLKATRMSKAYANNDIAEMRRLADEDKSGFSRDILDWIENGGRSAYIMGVANQTHIKDLVRELGGSSFAKTKAQVDKYFDIYGDTFEFTSRASAYATAKADLLQKNLAKGMERSQAEAAAKQDAAAYAKELTNFESVGRYGKEAGSLFMFFRPAATGAVRAIDALRPAFQNIDKLVAALPESVKSDPNAVAQYRAAMTEQQQHARHMIGVVMGMGFAMYLMAMSMADDDERKRNRVSTDDMSIWTRNLRLPVPGTDKFMQIPWGFGLGSFAAVGAQLAGVAFGNQKPGDAAVNTSRILLDAFVPIPMSQISPVDKPLQWAFDSITPSMLRPPLEFMMDTDSLGRQIYNNRQSKFGEAYTGGINVPPAYRDLARWLVRITNGEVNMQPDTLYFFANNYVDGMSKLAHGMYGMGQWAAGEKSLDWKTDVPGFSSFIGKKGNIDAREYEQLRPQVEKLAATMDMFKNREEDLLAFIRRHPEAPGLVARFHATEAALKPFQHLDKLINASDMSSDERKDKHDQLVLLQNMYRRNFLDAIKDLED